MQFNSLPVDRRVLNNASFHFGADTAASEAAPGTRNRVFFQAIPNLNRLYGIDGQEDFGKNLRVQVDNANRGNAVRAFLRALHSSRATRSLNAVGAIAVKRLSERSRYRRRRSPCRLFSSSAVSRFPPRSRYSSSGKRLNALSGRCSMALSDSLIKVVCSGSSPSNATGNSSSPRLLKSNALYVGLASVLWRSLSAPRCDFQH